MPTPKASASEWALLVVACKDMLICMCMDVYGCRWLHMDVLDVCGCLWVCVGAYTNTPECCTCVRMCVNACGLFRMCVGVCGLTNGFGAQGHVHV